MPLDSVTSSARSRARPAAAWSPSASRAPASSSSAVTSGTWWTPATEPSRTGASVSAAACGSSEASRSAATAVRICALQPRPCFFQPPLVQQHDAELGVGHPGERLLVPAMAFRQLDGLHASLRLEHLGPGQQHRVRLVGQAVELQIRPPDFARQGDAWFRCRSASSNRSAQISAIPRLMNAPACSRSCKICSPPRPPVSVSASGPDTRSSIEVRSSSRRTSSLCRSSTSASRNSATVRSVPENSAANRSGSGCPASDSAASRSPAAQPSVRPCNRASASSGSSTPAASNSARASARLNRRSATRISVSSPSSRSRCSPTRRSCRAARTNRSSRGARNSKSSSWGSTSCEWPERDDGAAPTGQGRAYLLHLRPMRIRAARRDQEQA
jgi:hypothetical protein